MTTVLDKLWTSSPLISWSAIIFPTTVIKSYSCIVQHMRLVDKTEIEKQELADVSITLMIKSIDKINLLFSSAPKDLVANINYQRSQERQTTLRFYELHETDRLFIFLSNRPATWISFIFSDLAKEKKNRKSQMAGSSRSVITLEHAFFRSLSLEVYT